MPDCVVLPDLSCDNLETTTPACLLADETAVSPSEAPYIAQTRTRHLTRPGQGPELQLRRREAARQPADQRAGGAGRHIQHRAGCRPDVPAQVVRRRARRCAAAHVGAPNRSRMMIYFKAQMAGMATRPKSAHAAARRFPMPDDVRKLRLHDSQSSPLWSFAMCLSGHHRPILPIADEHVVS